MHINVEYRTKSFIFYLNYTYKNKKTVESIDWLNEWRIFDQFLTIHIILQYYMHFEYHMIALSLLIWIERLHRIDQSEIDRSWSSNHQSWIVFFVIFRLSMIRNHESDLLISSNRQIEWYNWFHRIQMEQSLKRIIVSVMYCNWNYRFMISLCLMLH